MARGHLTSPAPPGRLVDVVADTGGLQAQVLAAAEIGLGLRLDGVSVAEVRTGLWERRSIVKTYGPRGTLHLLPARELPMWMAALRAIQADGAAMGREPEWIDAASAAEFAAATRDALDGRQLTREELAKAVAARVGAWAHERLMSPWGDLLAPAALSGTLCFGPYRGAKVTFVRADQWIGGWAEVDGREALDEVARRFLRAYGPSSAAEFGRWVGAAPAMADQVFERLAPELAAVDIEGTAALGLADDLAVGVEPARDVVRLLPQYDAFVLGSRPRERLIATAVNERIRGYARGRFEGAVALSTILLDGQLIGIWSRKTRARHLDVGLEVLVDVTVAQRRAIEAEADRLGRFLGLEPVIRFGTLA